MNGWGTHRMGTIVSSVCTKWGHFARSVREIPWFERMQLKIIRPQHSFRCFWSIRFSIAAKPVQKQVLPIYFWIWLKHFTSVTNVQNPLVPFEMSLILLFILMEWTSKLCFQTMVWVELMIPAGWIVQWFKYLGVELEVGSSIPHCAFWEKGQPVQPWASCP